MNIVMIHPRLQLDQSKEEGASSAPGRGTAGRNLVLRMEEMLLQSPLSRLHILCIIPCTPVVHSPHGNINAKKVSHFLMMGSLSDSLYIFKLEGDSLRDYFYSWCWKLFTKSSNIFAVLLCYERSIFTMNWLLMIVFMCCVTKKYMRKMNWNYIDFYSIAL